MIKNYLLISFRNLRKHFSYSLINVFGLGLGLATCLLLVTWMRHELSYETFNEKSERIYRGSLEYSFGGAFAKTAVSPNALMPALLTLPETETAVRVYNPSAQNPFIVRYENRLFQEEKFFVADSTFFKIFSYSLLKGNAEKALVEPNSLIVTQAVAKKYFGSDDPLGKIVRVNNARDWTITGVIADPPTNSILQFDFIGSFNSIPAGREQPTWWSANYQTFVLLQPNSSIDDLAAKTNEIVKKAVGGDLPGDNNYVRYNFIPLTDIYLKSEFDGEPYVVSDITYIYIFSAIALLVVLIACINYVNLATARAADRAKEVGIRKVVGAQQRQLFIQFIGESVIITLLAFFLAFMLSNLFLPLFNQLTGKTFSNGLLFQPEFVLSSVGVLILLSLLAGAYPAFAITSFKPVTVLKGNFRSSSKGIWLRKSLVVIQFGISVVLIMGTLVIIKQLNFIQGRKLGYDRENTIILPLDRDTGKNYEALKTELLRTGAAVHVGRGSESPVTIQAGYSINTEGSKDPGVITTGLLADDGYLPTVGIEIIAGRNFTKNDLERFQQDTTYCYIVNESVLRALYIEPNDAVGKLLSMQGSRKGEIIGVVKDFHFASLHTPINPLIIFPESTQFSKVFVKLPKGNVSASLEKVKSIYGNIIQHRPFEYDFLDQQYAALYTNEERMSYGFIVFATLAIIIACLGLLGLVSFTASQKTKEIGIRKALGARASNIVVLITKDFAVLVLIAIAIGGPIAYWTMSKWLDDFAYKTDIGIGPLAISSVLCLIIAFGTAGYQAVKAALIDPAKTLRNE